MVENNLFIRTPVRMVRNAFGIQVKCCCASCKKRKILSEKGRVCSLNGEPVAGSHCCKYWEMNRRLQNAGISGGKVKSWCYLTYYRERWLRQREDYFARRLRPSELLSAGDFRKEFEREYGTIFDIL